MNLDLFSKNYRNVSVWWVRFVFTNARIQPEFYIRLYCCKDRQTELPNRTHPIHSQHFSALHALLQLRYSPRNAEAQRIPLRRDAAFDVCMRPFVCMRLFALVRFACEASLKLMHINSIKIPQSAVRASGAMRNAARSGYVCDCVCVCVSVRMFVSMSVSMGRISVRPRKFTDLLSLHQTIPKLIYCIRCQCVCVHVPFIRRKVY